MGHWELFHLAPMSCRHISIFFFPQALPCYLAPWEAMSSPAPVHVSQGFLLLEGDVRNWDLGPGFAHCCCCDVYSRVLILCFLYLMPGAGKREQARDLAGPRAS